MPPASSSLHEESFTFQRADQVVVRQVDQSEGVGQLVPAPLLHRQPLPLLAPVPLQVLHQLLQVGQHADDLEAVDTLPGAHQLRVEDRQAALPGDVLADRPVHPLQLEDLRPFVGDGLEGVLLLEAEEDGLPVAAESLDDLLPAQEGVIGNSLLVLEAAEQVQLQPVHVAAPQDLVAAEAHQFQRGVHLLALHLAGELLDEGEVALPVEEGESEGGEARTALQVVAVDVLGQFHQLVHPIRNPKINLGSQLYTHQSQELQLEPQPLLVESLLTCRASGWLSEGGIGEHLGKELLPLSEVVVEEVDPLLGLLSEAVDVSGEQLLLQFVEALQEQPMLGLDPRIPLLDSRELQRQFVIELMLFPQVIDDLAVLEHPLALVAGQEGSDDCLRNLPAGQLVLTRVQEAAEIDLDPEPNQIQLVGYALEEEVQLVVVVEQLVVSVQLRPHRPQRVLQDIVPHCSIDLTHSIVSQSSSQYRSHSHGSEEVARALRSPHCSTCLQIQSDNLNHMSREQEKEVKVYTGTFISNERKKRAGGRIKCEAFPNKIEVMGRNQAIHESEVSWVEVRRYKREARNGRPEAKKEEKKKEEPQKQEKSPLQAEKTAKYKEKVDAKEGPQKDKEEVKGQDLNEKKSSKPRGEDKDESKNIKKRGYKLKEEQENPPLPSKDDNNQAKIESKTLDNPKEEVKPEAQIDNNQTTSQLPKENGLPSRENEEVRKEDEPIESEEEEEAEQQLEVIVARIKQQKTIKFQTKPFVGILYFSKRSRQRNSKKMLDNPIEQIMSDYFADLHPIHARLPIMELDDLTPENYKVLHEYAERVVKKDENGSKKKHLNDILDELTSVYILMTFSEWDGDTPLANIHKIIGKAMTIDGECERFLYEHGLNDLQYSELEEAAIPINPTPLHKYVDEMVFTIDPPTSTDLDDALSIQKLDSKHFRVGIHIADVTSYLGLIDREEIIKRTTSVYLPYRVYHMLNRNMVKVCSLDPGVERLAFSIWVVMDLEGNVVGESVVEKSIIKSRFKLSYGVVQDLISGNMDYPQFNSLHTCTQDEFEQLLEKLLNMTELATLHRSQRIVFDVFENRELEFKLDENRWPNECFVEKRYTAKKMVEEFMIIGNIESAKVIIKASPSNALVIHHPKPSKLAVTSFNEQFKNLELKFKFENVLDVQRQLIKIEENTEIDEQTKQVLFFRARRAMEPAIYRTYAEITQEAKELDKEKEGKERKEGEKAEEYPIIHFALGLQFYTHFTSPMRRMADILVHETLTQIITNQPLTSISSSEIEKINNGRKGTKRLKKDLNEIYLCLMIYHTKKPIECEGIISSFGLESVSIFIPLFDMQKEVLWKKEFKIYSIKRIRNKDNQLDVKLYHDPKTAKKDVYWVIQRFQKVHLTIKCTQNPPLKLVVVMEVESEKGPFTIQWIED